VSAVVSLFFREASVPKAEEVKWCLTVPAIWTDYQKQLMREAAIAAGMPDDDKRLQLVIEHEAAAYHARVSGVRTAHASGRRARLMTRGSRFLVADCGGGTVDITAYRTDSRNRLEEIGRECGGKFGSEYVNQAFLSGVLAKRFGSCEVIERLLSAAPASLLDVIDSWEKLKLTITTQDEEGLFIPLPAALDRLLSEEGVATRARDLCPSASPRPHSARCCENDRSSCYTSWRQGIFVHWLPGPQPLLRCGRS
jgi:molecular chaperone DnaK (HSP70)